MQMYAIWWLLTGLAIAVELLTGTFYLLMLAVGFAGAAVCAHSGLGETAQIVTATALGGSCILIWHWIRSKKALTTDKNNQAVHLDIGSEVTVTEWLTTSTDATARVVYRGSLWDAKPDGHETPSIGLHRIVALEGNTLMLQKTS